MPSTRFGPALLKFRNREGDTVAVGGQASPQRIVPPEEHIFNFQKNGTFWRLNQEITYPSSQQLFSKLASSLRGVINNQDLKVALDDEIAQLKMGPAFQRALTEIASSRNNDSSQLVALKTAALQELSSRTFGINVMKLIVTVGTDRSFYFSAVNKVALPPYAMHISVNAQLNVPSTLNKSSPTKSSQQFDDTCVGRGCPSTKEPQRSSSKRVSPAKADSASAASTTIKADTSGVSPEENQLMGDLLRRMNKEGINAEARTIAQSSDPVRRYSTLRNNVSKTLTQLREESLDPKKVSKADVQKKNPYFASVMEGFTTLSMSASYFTGNPAMGRTGEQEETPLGTLAPATSINRRGGGAWKSRTDDMYSLMETSGTLFPGMDYTGIYVGLQAAFSMFGTFLDTRSANNSSDTRSRVRDVGTNLRGFGEDLAKTADYLAQAGVYEGARRSFESRAQGLDLEEKIQQLVDEYSRTADPAWALRTLEEQEKRLKDNQGKIYPTFGWLVQIHNAGDPDNLVVKSAKQLNQVISSYRNDLNALIYAITNDKPNLVKNRKIVAGSR